MNQGQLECLKIYFRVAPPNFSNHSLLWGGGEAKQTQEGEV